MPLVNLRLPELLLLPAEPHHRPLDLPLRIPQRHIGRLRELPQRNAEMLQRIDGIYTRASHNDPRSVDSRFEISDLKLIQSQIANRKSQILYLCFKYSSINAAFF